MEEEWKRNGRGIEEAKNGKIKNGDEKTKKKRAPPMGHAFLLELKSSSGQARASDLGSQT